MTAAAHADFTRELFAAPPARIERMAEIVVAEAPRGGAIRLLDLGCGTGSLVFRLAEAMPNATLVGIDVSSANIEAAQRRQAFEPATSRLTFEAADYLQLQTDPFDVIVSDGVLHLVTGDTASLVAKLARDLRPGGVLVCDMPYSCAYNTGFAVLRRALRAVRSSFLDRAILSVARLLHGREMDDEALRQRVAYMYVPPERVMNEELRRSFAAAGLHARSEYPMPSTSPSQLRHRVTVFARADAAR